MKLLIIQSSPTSCHLLPPRFKNSPQHLIKIYGPNVYTKHFSYISDSNIVPLSLADNSLLNVQNYLHYIGLEDVKLIMTVQVSSFTINNRKI
jgi:hypothetical protein